MKHLFRPYIALSAILLTSLNSYAQPSKTYELTIEGVKVVVQPIQNNDIVEIQTIIKGGVQNYSSAQQGIESLAMSALTECGTLNDTKDAFKNKLDKVSGYVSAYTSPNYATIRMNCIQEDFNTVWPLYVDAITKPAFNTKDFTRIKQDAINNLKSEESNPDGAIEKLARETAFKGLDYAKSPAGTEKTIANITVEQTKKYYESILQRSRMFIVVVGDIDKTTLESKLHALLANIPQGQPFQLKKIAYQPTKNTFTAQAKENATNYIEGITSGPKPGSPDYNAFQLAMRIFYDKHFLNVRTKNGLSYAPQAWFNGGATSSAAVYVTTTDPNKYIAVLRSLIQDIKKNGFTNEEVKNMKTTYVTSTYYKQETNSAQASSYASNEVLHNNWRRSNTMNDDFNKVSVEEVDKAFNKYINYMTWVYQGDTTKVNPKLFTMPNNVKTSLPKMSLEKKNKKN